MDIMLGNKMLVQNGHYVRQHIELLKIWSSHGSFFLSIAAHCFKIQFSKFTQPPPHICGFKYLMTCVREIVILYLYINA
jgi:hypothetical protein